MLLLPCGPILVSLPTTTPPLDPQLLVLVSAPVRPPPNGSTHERCSVLRTAAAGGSFGEEVPGVRAAADDEVVDGCGQVPVQPSQLGRRQ
jgi:hypothetical protein